MLGLKADSSTHQANQLVRDSQPQSGATMSASETDIGLIKLTENTRLIIGVNTRTGVSHRKAELLSLIRVSEDRCDRNTALIGKFHRVANQIE